jgi:hypothetical protein
VVYWETIVFNQHGYLTLGSIVGLLEFVMQHMTEDYKREEPDMYAMMEEILGELEEQLKLHNIELSEE